MHRQTRKRESSYLKTYPTFNAPIAQSGRGNSLKRSTVWVRIPLGVPMKIEIERVSIGYKADCLDLPGSPPIGMGSSEKDAIIDLLQILVRQVYKEVNGPIELEYK